jgi:hypothetical protein
MPVISQIAYISLEFYLRTKNQAAVKSLKDAELKTIQTG